LFFFISLIAVLIVINKIVEYRKINRIKVKLSDLAIMVAHLQARISFLEEKTSFKKSVKETLIKKEASDRNADIIRNIEL
ncbi:MAG: hypothetical protein ABW185_26045, partial [Sedimenticola sp.]